MADLRQALCLVPADPPSAARAQVLEAMPRASRITAITSGGARSTAAAADRRGRANMKRFGSAGRVFADIMLLPSRPC